MSMPDDERRSWAELEAELSGLRRRAVTARRLGVKPSPRAILGCAIGGSLGLALVASGAVVHTGAGLAAGWVVLTAALVLALMALIATGVSDIRRQCCWPEHHCHRRSRGRGSS